MTSHGDSAAYVVSWSVGGTDVTTTYDASLLFGPSREDESMTWIEWLLRGLMRDGFDHLTIRPLGRPMRDAATVRELVRERREELERAGCSPVQAYVMALEERLMDEYTENQRLWDQRPEATV